MFLLMHWFKRKIKNQTALQRRTSYGILAGCIGLGSNLILFVIKVIIGLISGSISIITDAVNNLSDTFSSGLAIIGFKMAGKSQIAITHMVMNGRSQLLVF